MGSAVSIRDWRNAAVVFVLLSIVSVLFFYVSKRLRVQYREFGRISVSHQVCQGKIQVGLNANLSVQALQKPYEQVVRSDKTRHVGRFLLSEFAAFMPSAVAVQKNTLPEWTMARYCFSPRSNCHT